MQPFEKLASFYLGRLWDPATQETGDVPLLYDAKDLTTHAMCVGMTGSGKTGLGVGLLEEAALDGIPSLVIDPKGDMGNLCLSFPELAAQDFRPWVDPAEAARKGQDLDGYASSIAEMWRKGLAAWGQDGERIRRLREAVDFAIYTPGSTAGLPLTILRSFAAPPPALLEDTEALAERLEGAALGLLSLVGIEADPVQSREYILVSNVLRARWSEGKSPTLVDLVQDVQKPPFEKLGVLDLDSFYPAKERFGLAMRINNLLASPGFATWLEGDPLDIQRLLYTPEGRPRVSILSIAHLSDAERMFLVTSVLHETIAWMRQQAGTSSLRAILYMDEIFGFFPPVANPPSKRPMLTLLKQARAYGLGVVLATQNPVDLDYKGLSNIGTWFLGRLQTERDKARVLDGLESASAGQGLDRAAIDRLLSGLGKRVFLASNVHEDGPVAFQTRWAMSYLRGPLTRPHIETLMAGAKERRAAAGGEAAVTGAVVAAQTATEVAAKSLEPKRPVVPAGVTERFLEPAGKPGRGVLYRPALYAPTKLHYVLASKGVDLWQPLHVVMPLDPDADEVDWDEAWLIEDELSLVKEPRDDARFGVLHPEAAREKRYRSWQRALKNWLYAERRIVIRQCKAVKLASRAEESEGDFRIRVTQAFQERRDLELEKLRKRYGSKLATQEERIRKAQERFGREEDQLSQKKSESWLSAGTGLLGALFGRKVASRTNVNRVGSSLRSVGRISKEKGDVERAKAELEARHERLLELEAELEQAIETLEDRWHPREIELAEKTLAPRKSDLDVPVPALCWLPWRVDADGIATPAYGLAAED